MIDELWRAGDSPALPRKLSIEWVEGLWTYFDAPFSYDADGPRQLGFGVGRQIIGLYVVELLLKYALDREEVDYGNTHNLLICSGSCRARGDGA